MARLRPVPPVCRRALVSPEMRQRARRLRRRSTWAEGEAWEILRGRRCLGFKFRRQQPLGGFIVDFYCIELNLAIEIDGSVHDVPEQSAHDKSRDLLLGLSATTVVHVRNEQVTKEHLQAIIRRHLGMIGGSPR